METERGPKVAKRVENLKRLNKQVKHALEMFENNEPKTRHRPRIDDSWIITGKGASRQALNDCKNCSPFRKANFSQDPVYGNGIEIIFIPTYTEPGQWQGTVIANLYDDSGTFLQQYVSDVVMVEQPGVWNVIYEVSFDAEGAWLESDPALGMITDTSFVLGMPVEDQPQLLITFLKRSDVRKVSFTATPVPQRLIAPVGIGVRNSLNPRVRNWSYCTAASCTAGGVGCGVASLFGVAYPACVATTCSGGAVRCAFSAFFGV